MAKKYFPKALSVGLSLALCASLVAPSFAAASFNDLQQAIRHDSSEEGTYGANDDGTGAITAWVTTDGEGNQTINVRLDGDVQRVGEEGSVAFSQGNNVVLDLNNHTINGSNEDGSPAGKGGAILSVSKDNLTIQDNSEEGNGTITGGSTNSNGGGVIVTGGSATLEGGKISGNTAGGSGGGVSVSGGTFTMTGGEISSNTAGTNKGGNSGGGGVHVWNGGTFTMEEGSTITNNKVEGNQSGGGVAVHKNSTFNMNGGTISDNVAFNGDGVQMDNSSFHMTNGTITGGVTVADNNATEVTITGGTFSQLDEKYLNDGYGLIASNDTYRVVEHSDDNHTFVNGVCQVVGCNATAPVTPTPDPVITDEPEVEIEEVAVPLAAGPVTCAEFIDYLWRHEGEPEADLAVEHEYAEAISWALSIEIIDGETFEADELVTVAAVRDILANFAAYADMDVNVYALVSLTGDEDEAVLNCDEVLAEFFGE